MIEIPYENLKPVVLEGVIKDFVLREGTDYGAREYTLEEKIAQITAQLKSGKAKIVFEEESGTCTLVVGKRV